MADPTKNPQAMEMMNGLTGNPGEQAEPARLNNHRKTEQPSRSNRSTETTPSGRGKPTNKYAPKPKMVLTVQRIWSKTVGLGNLKVETVNGYTDSN